MRHTTTRKALCVLFSLTLVIGLCPAPARGTSAAEKSEPTSAAAEPSQETTTAAPADEAATATPASTDDETPSAQTTAMLGQGAANGAQQADPMASAAEPATQQTNPVTPAPGATTQQAEATTEGDDPDLQAQSGNLAPQTDDLAPGETKTVSRSSTTAAFNVAGAQNTATLADTGLYELKVKGAKGGQAGDGCNGSGGMGGSSIAVTPLDPTDLSVVTGGAGKSEYPHYTRTPGGANGGGDGGAGAKFNSYFGGGGSGGGASHIATTDGTLASFGSTEGVDSSVLLVAGGGGGGGTGWAGGSGGGAAGGNGTRAIERNVYGSVYGGSQVAPSGSGVIGQGAAGGNGRANTSGGAEGHGGGGGGYWGGAAVIEDGKWTKSSGGGGSAFINERFIAGEKSADGGSMTRDGSMVALTLAGTNDAAGTASVRYLASVITLDAGESAATTGSAYIYAAPDVDEYHLDYSITGLGDQATTITIPTRPDAQFLGYYTERAGAGTCYVNDAGTIKSGLFDLGSTTLYARWGHKVNFDANGVETTSFPEGQVVDDGGSATEPAEPTSVMHDFKGWSTSPSTFTEYDFSTTLTNSEPITLYAFWSPHVEFDLQGRGGAIDPQFLQKGETGQKAQRPEDPTETGYTFGGWYTHPSCADEYAYDFDEAVTTDTTLYAKWSANEYTVEFIDGETVAGTEDFVYDSAEKSLLTSEELGLSREGWTFAGWRRGDALQVDYTDGESVRNLSTVTGKIEFHAVWQRPIEFHAASIPALTTDLETAASLATHSSSDQTLPQLTDGATYSSVTAPILPTSGSWQGVGWVASEVVASAADVAAGESFMPMATEYFGLYHRELRLAFDGNGATSGSMDDLVDLQRMNASGQITSVTFVLPQNDFEREGHSFRTWDLGDPGDAITLKPAATEAATTTAHALWDELPAPAGPSQAPTEAASPTDRRSPSPATGDGPTWPAPLALALATAAIALGITRRTRRER
ncbi:InlB B-repeat-containing protein [Olsenella intestinalis]|uniref:InlB B-repeat-containing protein n=1 Tax=Olsenella intestinalis TaxID=2930083 RepID=UPI00200CCF5F|nr:InlB B-repeat-containing protein [Olsenella intestinalis]